MNKKRTSVTQILTGPITPQTATTPTSSINDVAILNRQRQDYKNAYQEYADDNKEIEDMYT